MHYGCLVIHLTRKFLENSWKHPLWISPESNRDTDLDFLERTWFITSSASLDSIALHSITTGLMKSLTSLARATTRGSFTTSLNGLLVMDDTGAGAADFPFTFFLLGYLPSSICKRFRRSSWHYFEVLDRLSSISWHSSTTTWYLIRSPSSRSSGMPSGAFQLMNFLSLG